MSWSRPTPLTFRPNTKSKGANIRSLPVLPCTRTAPTVVYPSRLERILPLLSTSTSRSCYIALDIHLIADYRDSISSAIPCTQRTCISSDRHFVPLSESNSSMKTKVVDIYEASNNLKCSVFVYVIVYVGACRWMCACTCTCRWQFECECA